MDEIECPSVIRKKYDMIDTFSGIWFTIKRKLCRGNNMDKVSVTICLIKADKENMCFFFQLSVRQKSHNFFPNPRSYKQTDAYTGKGVGVGEMKHKNPVNLTSFLSTTV